MRAWTPATMEHFPQPAMNHNLRLAASPRVFRSFLMAGFESACHINHHGQRLDMLASTQHDHFAADDYARLRQVGISSVRDAVRWHLIERPELARKGCGTPPAFSTEPVAPPDAAGPRKAGVSADLTEER